MRILIAIDGSETSFAAVNAVTDQAWPAGSEIRILHVCEPIYIQYSPTGFYVQTVVDAQIEYEKHMHDIVQEQVSSVKSKLPACQVSGKIIDGPAAASIVEDAQHWEADLIVLGSHGRKGFERFLIGSVAESVASRASCSVEVVKQKQPAAKPKCSAKVMHAAVQLETNCR